MTTSAIADAAARFRSRFASFESSLDGGPAWLLPLRRAAISRFTELGFPTRHDEEWRFTPIGPIVETDFRPAAPGRAASPEETTFGSMDCSRIVFVNGRFAPELSRLESLPGGMRVLNLAAALKEQAVLPERLLGRYARFDRQAFTALNTAFFTDGALVHVPHGVVVEEPIQILYLSAVEGEPTVSSPRTLIVAEENSQLRVAECYSGPQSQVYLTNAVTEVVLGRNSVVDHYRAQNESEHAYHVGALFVEMERSSTFASHSVSLGGAIVRNEANARLAAEGGECTLNGLYLAGGAQVVDNHTTIDHAMPHCASHEIYKGILAGRAHGVFNGKILVRHDAQKTDARQTNRTLLLSREATINTKPQLEIFADDVRCTHGATVGQLDEEAVFYLRTRGIRQDQARSMLTYAFAGEILDRVQIDALRETLYRELSLKLAR